MAMYTHDGTKICETCCGDIVLPDPEESKELRRIADAATESANLAKEQAKAAEEDSKFSKKVSIVSIAIALVSLVCAILTLIFG